MKVKIIYQNWLAKICKLIAVPKLFCGNSVLLPLLALKMVYTLQEGVDILITDQKIVLLE